jgi:Cu-Zn family superoxide dismutase
MFKFKRLCAVLAIVSFTAVNPALADHHKDGKKKTHLKRAVAVIQSTSKEASPDARRLGEIFFEEKDGKVHVRGHIRGLEPGSTHGFHIHQYGDFTEWDATSAGGHFNPGNDPHAGPDAKKHHAGDLGNVTADKNGTVTIDKEVDFITIGRGPHAILGRSVVLHANADDLKSQPSGDAGPRIGIGIIGRANPDSKP